MLGSRRDRLKILNYVQNVALNYDDVDFRSHYRLNRTAVENLCQELNLERRITLPGRPPIRPIDSILVTLWVLANQESFRGISDRFGLSKGHCHQVFIQTCIKICNLRRAYIVLPNAREDMDKCVQDFTNLRPNAFPNVIGCIDGTHISIKGNRTDNSYFNRKGYTSMIIQGVCNSRLEFIDIYCGWPGSGEYHLLRDSAYPLNTFLMVPFKNNGHLNRRQKHFNKTLSSSRVVIENAFGRLKGVFRRLKYLDLGSYQYFKFITVAACILHNLMIRNDIPVEFEIDEIEDVNNDLNVAHAHTATAKQKRTEIMNSLM